MEPNQGLLRAVIFLLAAGAENLRFPKDKTLHPSLEEPKTASEERGLARQADQWEGSYFVTRDSEVAWSQPTWGDLSLQSGQQSLDPNFRYEGGQEISIQAVSLGLESWRFQLASFWTASIRSPFQLISS